MTRLNCGTPHCMPGAPATVWSSTGIFNWWHLTCCRQWLLPSLINSRQDMCCLTYTQHLCRQDFHCCWSIGVKQSTVSAVTGHQLWLRWLRSTIDLFALVA